MQDPLIPSALTLALILGLWVLLRIWRLLRSSNRELREANLILTAELRGVPVAPAPLPSATDLRLASSALWTRRLRPAWGLGLLAVLTSAAISRHAERIAPNPSNVLKFRQSVAAVPHEVEQPVTNRPVGLTAAFQSPVSKCAPISLEYARRLAEWSTGPARIQPELVLALIYEESRFEPCAISSAGAQGLMQLKPLTANEVGVRDPFDPADNVAGGTRYLRYLLDRYRGDVSLALGAYKVGPTALDRRRSLTKHPDTAIYVKHILELAEVLTAD